MLRTALLSLVLIVSLSSSTSMFRKAISRRQSSDPQYCHAIEGFECKCSYYRVTCTTDRDLPSPINVLPNEEQKYQSVELVIAAATDINVNDQTFAPVKALYKPDGDNLEFRVKFEKFTGLYLTSAGIFNNVFPDNLQANARKHLALEIYNPLVPPNDNPNLFKNLNADSVELYGLYPFKGSFQQLFEGANIKYLRLSGGEIRSDVSQQFTGNIGRLEIAKQASVLSVQNFPVYPAHELTIDAFYIDNFTAEHPPNYNNLGELRVHSIARIPADAFRNFPKIHTLQISTEHDIDPQALNGLNNLEKLIIKDTKLPLDLLQKLPNLKEFETNIEKLDENTQCQLLEKLANGHLAVQAIPNGRECTCVSAYLDTAGGRTPCDAQHCEHSSCAAIKNNYNAETRTFNAPPAITRADGTNALRQRETRVYTAPAQVAYQDQEKLQKGIPPPVQQTEDDGQRPGDDGQGSNPQDTDEDTYSGNLDIQTDEKPHRNDDVETDSQDRNDDPSSSDNNQDEQDNPTDDENDDYNIPSTTTTTELDGNDEKDVTVTPDSSFDDQQGGDKQDNTDGGQTNQGGDNQQGGDGNESQSGNNSGQEEVYFPEEGASGNGTETEQPPKKGMSWLPIIIIAAAIAVLLLIGLVVLLIRKKRTGTPKGGYGKAATDEPGATTAPPRS